MIARLRGPFQLRRSAVMRTLLALCLTVVPGLALAAAHDCGLAQPAFCDTFDAPNGTGNRSGDLDGKVWGVSRELGAFNSGQGQFNSASPVLMDRCGTAVTVAPPHDVSICNGQLVEAQYDQHGVTSLAMYPKQPFDFAGRTGTVVFDVSDD